MNLEGGLMRHAANPRAWAIGRSTPGGFRVRRVVWGRLLAKQERRPDEEIRAATILVEGKRNLRRGKAPVETGKDDHASAE